MNQKDKRNTIRRYAERIEELGTTVQALGWRDREQQYLRFRILAEVDNLEGKSVLDVGCGFGDLYLYLKKMGVQVDYTGIDINPSIIDEASKRHPDACFKCVDLLSQSLGLKFDYVVESGIFNYKISDNEGFIRNMLQVMFDHCRLGIAANMMTAHVDYYEDHLYYYDFKSIASYARELSRLFLVRHDYPLYEFTLFVYRQSRYT